jgi:hypothetical protein
MDAETLDQLAGLLEERIPQRQLGIRAQNFFKSSVSRKAHPHFAAIQTQEQTE